MDYHKGDIVKWHVTQYNLVVELVGEPEPEVGYNLPEDREGLMRWKALGRILDSDHPSLHVGSDVLFHHFESKGEKWLLVGRHCTMDIDGAW